MPNRYPGVRRGCDLRVCKSVDSRVSTPPIARTRSIKNRIDRRTEPRCLAPRGSAGRLRRDERQTRAAGFRDAAALPRRSRNLPVFRDVTGASRGVTEGRWCSCPTSSGARTLLRSADRAEGDRPPGSATAALPAARPPAASACALRQPRSSVTQTPPGQSPNLAACKGTPTLDAVRNTNVIHANRQVAVRRAAAALLRALDHMSGPDDPETQLPPRDVAATIRLRRDSWPPE